MGVSRGFYEDYLRAEWARYQADPARAAAALAAVDGVDVRRVLEIGCGAGQEMLPFARHGARCLGLDPFPVTGRLAAELWASAGLPPPAFLRGEAERLPFPDQSFDVVVCRLALPFTDNPRALAEMERVLARGGRILLKWHHFLYYPRHAWRGLIGLRPRLIANAVRTTACGTVYHLLGRPVRNRWLGIETYQTRSRLRRELAILGLRVRGDLPDTNPFTPSQVLERVRT